MHGERAGHHADALDHQCLRCIPHQHAWWACQEEFITIGASDRVDPGVLFRPVGHCGGCGMPPGDDDADDSHCATELSAGPMSAEGLLLTVVTAAAATTVTT